MKIDTLIFVLEIAGTVAFAISGVITALNKKLDILGAVILGLVTAVGGGMLRDIILGYLPPAAFRHPVYSVTAISVSVAVYIIAYYVGTKVKQHYDIFSQVINVFDSLGLAVFTIGGVNAAHSCGFTGSVYISVFVGTLTGVGGGVLRDIMAGKVPVILEKRVYALAAIAGAVVYQLMTEFSVVSDKMAVLIGAGSILIIRILATIFRWNLPRIKNLAD